ncbi:MAG: hypothetical protein IJ074_01805, partial [Clostridia bacterium]|nr:hypothetical protein [Clostridia bacterium]
EHALFAAPAHALIIPEEIGMLAPADYSYRSFVEILLGKNGALPATGAQLFRDNFNIYLLPAKERGAGIVIRRGKNLAGMVTNEDASQLILTLLPVGLDRHGEPLAAPPVHSPYRARYPFERVAVRQYAIQEDPEGPYPDAEYVYHALTDAARAEFDAGIDLPRRGMEIDYVDLQEPDAARGVHLFDTVTVIDELLGVRETLRVTGTVFNALTERMERLYVGDGWDE